MKQFKQDLQRFYNIVQEYNQQNEKFFDALTDKSLAEYEILENELLVLDLEVNDENLYAMASRINTLRDETLRQSFNKAGFSEEEIIQKTEIAYKFVSAHYIAQFEKMLQQVEEEALLTPFYRAILQGTHKVGKAITLWQSTWTATIINGANKELVKTFGSNEDALLFLRNALLFDTNEQGEVTERCYSALIKEKGSYTAKAYVDAFKPEAFNVIAALKAFVQDLSVLEDEIYGQKEAYSNYLNALIAAFGESDTQKTLNKWADVDRKWMQVQAPIQIGHPLEYYEDHLRKAVALEWDIRLSNPLLQDASKVEQTTLHMFKTLFDELGSKELYEVYKRDVANVKRVQLYLGRPAVFYGAEFCGLFSAQVVPNDETVTKEEGKKIFAFADKVLEGSQAKPFMKITKEVFGEAFTKRQRQLLFKRTDVWHKIYEISTIGHEYGHILWLDEDTEVRMNKQGVFKNIEEFKATSGGLVSFFLSEEPELRLEVLEDVLKRAVGLIAWMKTDEVQPYYCEGLIHLQALFETGVLDFDDTLHINVSLEKYEAFKTWYLQTYKTLASHYLAKKEANEFLQRYAVKQEGVYMPVNKKVKAFVTYYWDLHQEIGGVVDTSESKNDWIEK